MAKKYTLGKAEKKQGKINLTFNLQDKVNMSRLPKELELEIDEKDLLRILPSQPEQPKAKPAARAEAKKDEAKKVETKKEEAKKDEAKKVETKKDET